MTVPGYFSYFFTMVYRALAAVQIPMPFCISSCRMRMGSLTQARQPGF